MSTPEEVADIVHRLAAPFAADQVKVRPTNVKGGRCLALHYVDARVVQDRLDEVLGVAGWQDSYKLLPDGSVMCRLRIRLGDQWITKVDVGGQSEQPDGGDRAKAAFSDALKRAAVKFGVGRYLYGLPSEWMDYDPQRRCIVNPGAAKAKRAGAAPARPPARPAPAASPPANGTPPTEDLDQPIGPVKAADLLERCRKLGWEAEGPNGWLAWIGWHPSRQRGDIPRRMARAVLAKAKAMADKPPLATAPAAAPPAGPMVTSAHLDELRGELSRVGRDEDSVYRFLRLNPGPAGLAGLTVAQWETVMGKIASLPATVPAGGAT